MGLVATQELFRDCCQVPCALVPGGERPRRLGLFANDGRGEHSPTSIDEVCLPLDVGCLGRIPGQRSAMSKSVRMFHDDPWCCSLETQPLYNRKQWYMYSEYSSETASKKFDLACVSAPLSSARMCSSSQTLGSSFPCALKIWASCKCPRTSTNVFPRTMAIGSDCSSKSCRCHCWWRCC